MRRLVFVFFLIVLIIQALTISGSANPDYGLILLLNFLTTAGLVLISYWVWQDGKALEQD